MGDFAILLGAYLVLGTVISILVARRNRTASQFFVADGALGWVVTAMTYAATTYSAFMMVGLVGLSWSSGVGALVFELVYLVATVILLGVYGPRIWDAARADGAISPMEILSSRFGAPTATVGTVLAAIALVPYTAVQVIGLAVIMEGFGVTFTSGVIFAAVVIVVWALLGGLRGVAITDALQGAFMFVLAILALRWVGQSFDGFELSTFPNAVWTPRFFVNLTLPWAFFAVTNPQVVQRIFVLKEKRDLPRMITLFAVFGLIYTLIVTYVGFGAKAGTLAGVFPEVLGQNDVIVAILGRMGRGLALMLALSIVFASVSTANSILLTLASMVTRDVVGRDRGTAMVGRAVVVVLTAAVALFALTRPSAVVQLSVATSRLLMIFLPLLFARFHLKTPSRWSGPITLVAGFAMALLFGRVAPAFSSVLTFGTAFAIFAVAHTAETRRTVT